MTLLQNGESKVGQEEVSAELKKMMDEAVDDLVSMELIIDLQEDPYCITHTSNILVELLPHLELC